MTVPAPLTEAEKAAAEVLAARHNAFSTTGRLAVSAFEDEARAVVAAVRPLIEAEALREEATYLSDHRRDDDGPFDLWRMYEAGGPEWLASRAAARQSLSRPTSEETPNR